MMFDLSDLIYILHNLDRRICALEMDSEGRGDESCQVEIDELESPQCQTDGPESTPEAT